MSWQLGATQAATSSWSATQTTTVVVGIVAFVGVVIGVAQKWRTDRREHWWRRTQWALDQLSGDDGARTIGLLLLARQLDSKLATTEDRAFMDDVASVVIAEPPP